MDQQQVTVTDLVLLLGQKEVELSLLRRALAEAQAKLAETDKKE